MNGIIMNVLILNQHFYPEIAATAQIITDLAEDLQAKGISVSVVTGVPSYTNDHSRKKIKLFEMYRGVKIYRVPTTNFDRHNKVGRIINYLTFYVLAFIRCLSICRPDVVISMTTPPFLSLIGVILKKMKNTKLVCRVADLYPEIAVEFEVLKKGGFLEKILKKLSSFTYRHSDMVVPLGVKMNESLREYDIEEDRIRVIYDWADPDDFKIDDWEQNPIRERMDLEGKFSVFYSGNMGIAHDFECVKEAFLKLKNRNDLIFVFIGDGAKKKDLEKFVSDKGLETVHFLPYQPREMLKYSMNAGDAILITQDFRSAGFMVPSKIFSALAVGKPIVAVGPEGSELHDITEKCGCGVFVKNGDAEGVVSGIDRLMNEKDFYEMCSNNCKELFSRKFQRRIGTETFADILHELSD